MYAYVGRVRHLARAVGDVHIDVAPLRRGGEPPDQSTRPSISPTRALRFTVDARPLAVDDIVDPLSGRTDLAAGRLRLCSPVRSTTTLCA